MNWRDALYDLETNPDIDPEERHRLANVVRDDVDALERGVHTATKRGADAMKALEPPATNEKSMLAWARGTSFSLRIDGDADSDFLQDIHAKPPGWFRLRPEPASAKRLTEAPTDAWKRGLRVRLKGYLVEEELMKELDPGDWIVTAPHPRNIGGHTGRALIATFSYLSLRTLSPATESEEVEDE